MSPLLWVMRKRKLSPESMPITLKYVSFGIATIMGTRLSPARCKIISEHAILHKYGN